MDHRPRDEGHLGHLHVTEVSSSEVRRVVEEAAERSAQALRALTSMPTECEAGPDAGPTTSPAPATPNEEPEV
jgi:hypothetical protein